MKTWTVIAGLCLLGAACFHEARGQAAERSVAPGINDRYATEEGRDAAAQIFEGSDREQYQKSDEVIRHMQLRQGDVVCEIGAGTGYFTPFLANAVGASGKVYAEDPQREFIERLKTKVEREQLRNVVAVVGAYEDTNLPDGSCDVAFILDTYHHFEWPRPMLAAIAQDLKPGGRMIIVDFERQPNPLFERWNVDFKQHLRLDRDGVIKEIEGYGWRLVETRSFLEHQYFLVFQPLPKS